MLSRRNIRCAPRYAVAQPHVSMLTIKGFDTRDLKEAKALLDELHA
jgi:hypothetical protein